MAELTAGYVAGVIALGIVVGKLLTCPVYVAEMKYRKAN